MIDFDEPEKVLRLIEGTREEFRPLLELRREILSTMYGVTTEAERIDDEELPGAVVFPEKVHHEYVEHVAAHLGFRAPRYSVRSPGTQRQRAMARALGMVVNDWARQPRIRKVFARLLVDMLTSWAVAAIRVSPDAPLLEKIEERKVIPAQRVLLSAQHVAADERPAEEVLRSMPDLVRINPRDAFWDLSADSFEGRRFQGHVVRMSRAALEGLADAEEEAAAEAYEQTGEEPLRYKYDRDAIEELADFKRADERSGRGATAEESFPAVELAEVWFPGIKAKDAERFEKEFGVPTHGSIALIGLGGNGGRLLRELRPYGGPESGPYVTAGMIELPDEPLFQSPTMVAHGAAIRYNASKRACNRAADKYKRVIFYDSKHGELADDIEQADDSWLVPVDNLMRDGKPTLIAMEVGGLTDQLLKIKEEDRQTYERVSGLGSVRRGGAATGRGTATENVIADSGADARIARIEGPWDGFGGDIGRAVAAHVHSNRAVVTSLSEEDTATIARELGWDQPGTMPEEVVEELGLEEGRPAWVPGERLTMRGGGASAATVGTFETLDVAVETASQRKPDEPARAAAIDSALQTSLQLIPMMAQIPDGVDWRGVLDVVCESRGEPEFAGKFDVAKITGNPALAGITLELVSPTGEGRKGPTINVGGGGASPATPDDAPAVETPDVPGPGGDA